jgi:hypothetical protein
LFFFSQESHRDDETFPSITPLSVLTHHVYSLLFSTCCRYRIEAMKYHPDRVQGEEEKAQAEIRFKDVNEAYSILSDSEKRQRCAESAVCRLCLSLFTPLHPTSPHFTPLHSTFLSDPEKRQRCAESVFLARCVSFMPQPVHSTSLHITPRRLKLFTQHVSSLCETLFGLDSLSYLTITLSFSFIFYALHLSSPGTKH